MVTDLILDALSTSREREVISLFFTFYLSDTEEHYVVKNKRLLQSNKQIKNLLDALSSREMIWLQLVVESSSVNTGKLTGPTTDMIRRLVE